MNFSIVRDFNNRRTSASIAATALSASLLVPLLAGCGSSDKTLAKVGGQTITEKQFLQQAKDSPQGTQLLSGLMAEAVVTQEAAAKGVLPTDAQVNAELALAEKSNPQFEQSLAKDRANVMRTIKELVCVDNLLKKEANITPASEQQWWSSHHDLFDQQAAITVIPLVFDSMQKARQAEDLLKKGSTPKDVAASLGDPTFSANGIQSPPQTKEQAMQV
ncbi:MAG: hypothetical protein LC772_02160, partial [Chloroflexi bacterium]|nr:hypothetical protein [Chloroflexota bacterium]